MITSKSRPFKMVTKLCSSQKSKGTGKFLLILHFCQIHYIDSQKTRSLKTKTVDFSINNKQFSSNYLEKAKTKILFLLKNPKN